MAAGRREEMSATRSLKSYAFIRTERTGRRGLRNDARANTNRASLPFTAMTLHRHWLLPLFTLFSILAHVRASALTTAISPNERLCFFADVDTAGEKIGVRFPPLTRPRVS
jgi:hypothetical protein